MRGRQVLEVGHRNTRVELSWKRLPCCQAFTVPEGGVQATREGKPLMGLDVTLGATAPTCQERPLHKRSSVMAAWGQLLLFH